MTVFFSLIHHVLTTCRSEGLDQLCPNHNPSGTLHTLHEQDIGFHKALNQLGSSNCNLIQDYPFHSSSHAKPSPSWVQDGRRVHAGTCAQMAVPALFWKAHVWRGWEEWAGDPQRLELERTIPCRVLNLKMSRGKSMMNQKKTKSIS